jgi:hypothetical protein
MDLLEYNKQTTEKELSYYDYDFTLFFKNASDKIQRHIKSPKPVVKDTKEATPKTPAKTEQPQTSNPEYQDVILQSYKELIRQQDRELDTLKKRNIELEMKLKQIEDSKEQTNIQQVTTI